jgi:outer membrane protein assembly factor BamB
MEKMKKDQFSRLVILLLILALNSFRKAYGQSGREILEQTGVKGGLIVHIDCGDGQLTAALRDNERYIVHGLDTNTKDIEAARRHIQSLGLYGPVSVQQWNGVVLPYADNLASLVVVDKPNRISMNEIMRVLRPLGVAYVNSGSKWIKTTKPWPDEIDEWTHWQHSADGNAVARDKVVDSPRRIQWVADPVWQRHHNLVPSTSAMVSSRGRMFIIEDEAQTSANAGELPDKWYLVARDAFSGVLLWKRPIKEWGWKTWNTAWEGRFNQPPQLPKRLVAAGDRVYVTLGFSAPVSEIDAATGKVLRILKGTERTDEIIYQDGKLVLSIGYEAPKPSEGRNKALRRSVCVIDLDSGKKLWDKGAYSGLQAKTDSAAPFGRLELVAGKKQVFLMDQSAIVGLDLDTGRQNWRIARPKAKEYLITRYFIRYSDQCVLVYQDGVILLAQPTWEPKRGWHSFPGTLYAFSAADGKLLWKYPYGGWSHNWQPDVFVVDDKVWIHEHTIVEDNDWRTGHRLDKSNIDYFLIGLDLQTGKIKRRFSTNKTLQTDHHHRCYRAKATERFFIASRRGAEFINYETGHNSLNHWARGACLHGFVPCNGMLYLTPHPCVCYLNTKLNGYYALAPKSERAASAPTTDIAAFEPGPAYEQAYAGRSATANANDWPTFRHDASRSGSTRASVSHKLKLCWEAAVGGKLTPPVVAGGKVFVASIDEHRVVALTESNGKQVWDFTAGGRIDTPPTIHKGLVLFGSADGWAYCLRESDGQFVWRHRLAPEARLIGARNQLESAWPVHGSILVKDNIAYAAAGRSSYLDSGIFLYELDPVNGNILKKRILYSPDPETDEMIPPDIFVDRKTLQGTKSDILVSAGSGIFMRRERVFGDNMNLTPYLFAGGGFRDENWFNRVSWEVGPIGKSQLLVFTDKRAYGVKAYLGKGLAKSFQHGNNGHGLWAGELNLNLLSNSDSKEKGKELWSENVPVRFNALAAAGEILFAAGAIDTINPADPLAPFEGRADSKLWAVDGKDGRKLSEYHLEGTPVYDGMAVTEGRVFVAMKTGKVICFASTGEMGDVMQVVKPIASGKKAHAHTRTYIISDPQDSASYCHCYSQVGCYTHKVPGYSQQILIAKNLFSSSYLLIKLNSTFPRWL